MNDDDFLEKIAIGVTLEELQALVSNREFMHEYLTNPEKYYPYPSCFYQEANDHPWIKRLVDINKQIVCHPLQNLQVVDCPEEGFWTSGGNTLTSTSGKLE